MPSRTLYAQNPVSLRIFPFLPGYRQRFLIPMKIQYSYGHTFVQQYTLNPAFEIVQGSVKVCTPGMSSRTIYAQHPVSLHLSPVLAYVFLSPGKSSTLQCTTFDRLWPTIFDPDTNSVLLRAHLCTAVDSMRRKSCVRNC